MRMTGRGVPVAHAAEQQRRETREAKAELDRRYREQCFRADKAINLRDWATALAELRTLCDLVPDDRDPRHAEANAKLLDVEARQKGGRK